MPYRDLPPLNAIRAFESAARTGGVRAAADELSVSQSAISRHIANLEKHLQTGLFLRSGKRVILTETGREYLQQLEPALDAIARASERAANIKRRERLNVSAPPSFIVNWIMPRLGRFFDQYPEIELRLVDRMTFQENELGLDCAIEYRIDTSPRLLSQALFADEIVPMASPEYITKNAIRGLEDARRCTLIETERRLVSWADVFQEQPSLISQKTLIVSLSLHALEAARCGYGIALANRHNSSQLVDSGDLEIPFTIDQSALPMRPQYYYSVRRSGAKPKSNVFKDWIDAEISSQPQPRL